MPITLSHQERRYKQMSSVDNETRNEQPSSAATEAIVPPALLHSLEWRLIGPYRGGRVVAVAGDPVHDQVFYFGSTGGGVWKTTDGGRYLGKRFGWLLQARLGRRARRCASRTPM